MNRSRIVGTIASAVVLAACGGGDPVPEVTPERVLGITLDVPVGFEEVEAGAPGSVLDRQALLVGPAATDGTRVGVFIGHVCSSDDVAWEQVLLQARAGQHTDWATYELVDGPTDVEVPGALDAVRVGGTYTLEVAATGERATLRHEELLVHATPGVYHRIRVEGVEQDVPDALVDRVLGSVVLEVRGCPA